MSKIIDRPNIIPVVNCARGYVRISTELQTDGFSIDTQKQRIGDYCRLKNLNLVKIYEDVASGGTMDRPGLNELKKELCMDEILIVATLNRLSRNTEETMQFRSEILCPKRCKLVVTEMDIDFQTPHGEMMLTMMLATSQYERRVIKEQVKVNMQRMSKEGKLRTVAPFGWKFVGKDKAMEKDEEQQNVLAIILEWYDSGMNVCKITKTLNEKGLNACIQNNKKIKKEYRFMNTTIDGILIDHNKKQLKEGKKRQSLEQRIKCHRGT